ncbi:response regulator transcription factor [Erwinia tasmaniensis]|uniref:Two component transcriptional regulator, LuxR family n=1 Tax=Erwinia tasmaniensis (strain DSM 17950 / CFBP 7177 / CIP 109463 / NCPPB 4357 / Et1/99) TaxID=465817 RepID=B2VCI0_ERWT9|nr:response regulator transcription factor [Erwinia tasmaniensis]CAO98468.1 Putative two component transcriptional regulator, LuxR family [Erwinia tasmaniensis Et1/99]
MKKNNVTVVINDPNRFYFEGLKSSVYENFLKQGFNANYTESAFNSRAKIIFLAEESLSLANIHYLNRRMSMRPLCIFIIKNAPGKGDTPDIKTDSIHHYAVIYRNQSVESILAVVNAQMEQMNNFRTMPSPLGVNRSNNNLTRRETEILRYLARGITNGGVARFLNISEKTVSAHKRNIMSKLNMVRPAELSYWLIQEGWCESLRSS